MERRNFLATASCGLLGGVAGTSQSAAATRVSNTARTGNILTENGNVQYESDSNQFVYEFEYNIPKTISELTIRIDKLSWEGTSVRETRGVSREDDTSFLWDGRTTPRLTIESQAGGETLPDGVPGTYASESEALEGRLRTRLPFRYRGEAPLRRKTLSIKGEGFAGGGFVYAGPLETYAQSAAGTEVTIVVPDSIEISIPHEELLDAFAFAEENITPRISRDRMAAFIVPNQWGGIRGSAVRNDILLHDTVAQVADIDSVATHEYVHTIFGVFGGGDAYWLKEAIAEYYGYLIALNVGSGTFDAFLREVTTDRYQDAVLADGGTMKRTPADYYKGAHVMAALDAEIQRVSNGSATLNDVFTTDEFDLSTLTGFESAVVEVSGTSSLSQWLDRYVRSESLPEIPSDPQYFVLGDRDLDSLNMTPDSIGPWQTAIKNDASVEGNETALTIRARKCSGGSVTRPVNETPASISFDYEIEAGQEWGRPYVQVLDAGAAVWTGDVGRSDLSDERVFEISAGETTHGHVEKSISETGPLQVRIGITSSEACSATDHGNTWLRVTNFEIHSQSLDETTENSSADASEDSSTDTDENSPADTNEDPLNGEIVEDEIPGFGIVSALGALGSVGYLLKHRLTDDEASSK